MKSSLAWATAGLCISLCCDLNSFQLTILMKTLDYHPQAMPSLQNDILKTKQAASIR